MYNIKLATDDNIDVLLELGKKFYDTTTYNIPWDEDSVTQYVFNILDSGVFLLVTDESDKAVGLLGAFISPFPFNNNVQVCTEAAWWLDEEARGGETALAMIKSLEEIAKQENCAHITLSSLVTSPEGIGRFYKSLGYTESESVYLKTL